MTFKEYFATNILLVQMGDIGDVVLTSPTIRAVKETYPNSQVSILVRKPFGDLLKSDSNLHEIVENTKSQGSRIYSLLEYINFVRRLRKNNYDLVIDLRTGDRGAILSFFTGAAVRVGRHEENKPFWHDRLFTRIIRDPQSAPLPIHPGADQSLRVVREIGIDTKNSTPQIYVTPDELLHVSSLLSDAGIILKSKMVTINPFSRWKYKEWNNLKWGEVIDRIWEVYRIPSVLIGSKEESKYCKKIIAGREEYAFNLAGKTSLGELAALISLSSLHLGVDSAAPHIAAARGVSTVTIHGPTDWRAWRIVNEQHRVVSPVMDCLPCNMMGCSGSGKSLCLDELTVQPVVSAALDLLALSLNSGTNRERK